MCGVKERFLFKMRAIILEVCGYNLVERDKIMVLERGDDSCWRRDGPETLQGHKAHHCNKREVDVQAYVKVGQFGYGKMKSFSSECFYLLSEIISEVTS